MPAAAAPKRYPLQCLLEETGLTEREMRHLANCSSLVWREAKEGGCTLSQADRWAMRAGVMAEWVWPNLWHTVTPEQEAWVERWIAEDEVAA